jgi:hypothetical protein
MTTLRSSPSCRFFSSIIDSRSSTAIANTLTLTRAA